MKLIGLTGTFSSGKDTVAEYLASKGFQHISTGDIIREHVRERGIPIDRDTLHSVSNEIRKARGRGVFAEEALERINGDAVISGLRNVAEVEALKNHPGATFVMLAVDAPIEIRWERAHSRGRIGDEVTLEKFRAQEALEMSNPAGQQMGDVMRLADYTIMNEGTLEDLKQDVEKVLSQVT